MADKVIAAKLQVDTGNSNANILEVNKNLRQVNESLDNTSKAASNTGKGVEGAGGSFGKLKASIGSLPGPLGQAGEGVGKLSGAFKALLLNPVGLILAAIVATLALLYKAFTNTFEGAQKVEQIFAGIKAAGQALLDNLEKIGSAIKNVFTFNFSGAKKDLEEVAGAAKKAFTAMSELTKEAQKLKVEQLQNDLEGAERAKKLAQLREDATDDSIPIKERIKLGKQLLAEAEENAKSDIDLAKRTTENKIKQLTLQKDGERKNAEEITQLKIEQINVETQNSGEIRRIRKQVLSAEKQEEGERKAAAKEAADRQKEANAEYKRHLKEKQELAEKAAKQQSDLRKAQREAQQQEVKDLENYGLQLAAEQAKIDKAETDRIANNEKVRLENRKKLAELDLLNNPDSSDKKLAKIDSDLQLELSKLAEGDLQRQILAKKAGDEAVRIRQEEKDAKVAIGELETQQRINQAQEVGNRLGQLSDIIGRNTAVGKGIAIAQATINTFQGATEALREKSVLPQPFATISRIINVAATIATGLATVRKIVSIQVPGGGGGGGGSVPSAPSIAAPLAPTAQSTRLDNDSLNNIGNAVAPVQAFVVESQGADSQERISRLNRAARLGGN